MNFRILVLSTISVAKFGSNNDKIFREEPIKISNILEILCEIDNINEYCLR